MLLSLLTLLLVVSPTLQQRVLPVKDPKNILVTFGSCNKDPENKSHLFSKVADLKSDVWIWLGDAAYTDRRVFPMYFVYAGESKIIHKFEEVKNSLPYKKLLNSTKSIIGVWDDHDYGINNGGKYFQHKTLTQQLYLDFLDEPEDSPRRKQEGVYESYYIGDKTKVKVILLDVRYFKDESSPLGGGDILGEHQWKWLEEQLQDNPAKFTVIGSGIQVLPDDRLLSECWYVNSRDKLIGLFQKYKTSGVFLISGDVHFTEIMKHPCRERVGFDLYEFTSSGVSLFNTEFNPKFKRFSDTIYAETWNTDEDRIFEENFGMLRFNFEGERPHLFMESRNKKGEVLAQKDIDYARLTFDEELLNHNATCVLDVSKYGRFMEKYVESLVEFDPYAYYWAALLGAIIFVIGLIFASIHWVLWWVTRKIKGDKHKQGHKHKEQKAKKE